MPSPLRLTYTTPIVEDPAEELARSVGAERTALGPLGQGLTAGGEGMAAGTAQYLSDLSEAIGLDPTTLRGFAAEHAARAQQYAPAVQSYTQVTDIPSAADYGLGLIGQGLPSVAVGVGGALLGRSVLRNPWGALPGAAATVFPMEAGETALTLAQDPNTRSMPVRERVGIASRKGAINAGIEMLGSPASLVSRVGTGAARRGVVRETLAQVRNEALTEGAQEAIGLAAHSVADPSRNTAGDIEQVINAMIGGGLLGGGMGAVGGAADTATAGAEGLADMGASHGQALAKDITDVSRRAVDAAAPYVRSFAQDITDASGRAVPAFRSMVDRLTQGDQHPSMRGATIDETAANLEAADAERPELVRQILGHPDMPESIRRQFANADMTTPEAQADLGRTATVHNMGVRANHAIKGFVARMRKMLSRPEPPVEEGAQQSRMRTSPMLMALMRNMKPELRGDPEMARALPGLANGLQEVLTDGSPEQNLSKLRELVLSEDWNDVLVDPTKFVDDVFGIMTHGKGGMAAKLQATRIAETDVGKPDSFLMMNITRKAQEELTMPQLRWLAKTIDNHNLRGGIYSGPGREQTQQGADFTKQTEHQLPRSPLSKRRTQLEYDTNFEAAMKEIFGSAADDVRDYYAERHTNNQSIYAPQELLQSLDSDELGTSADKNVETEGPEALGDREVKPMYRYGDPMRKLPYVKGKAKMDKALIEGAITRGAWSSVVPYSQVVEEQRGAFDLDGGLNELLAGITESRNEALMSMGEQARTLYEKTGNAKAALDLFEVLKVEGYDLDPFIASDADLQSMRKMVDVLRKTDLRKKSDAEKEHLNLAKETLITFFRRAKPDEKTTLGKQFLLSSESMWQTWQKKFPGQQTDGEAKPSYIRRMFEEALGAVITRDDILGTTFVDTTTGEIENHSTPENQRKYLLSLPDNLLLDRSTETRLEVEPGFTTLPNWKRVGHDIVEVKREKGEFFADFDRRMEEVVGKIDDISVYKDDKIDEQDLLLLREKAEGIEDQLLGMQTEIQRRLGARSSDAAMKKYKAWAKNHPNEASKDTRANAEAGSKVLWGQEQALIRRLNKFQWLFTRLERAMDTAQQAYVGEGVADTTKMSRNDPDDAVRTYERDTGTALHPKKGYSIVRAPNRAASGVYGAEDARANAFSRAAEEDSKGTGIPRHPDDVASIEALQSYGVVAEKDSGVRLGPRQAGMQLQYFRRLRAYRARTGQPEARGKAPGRARNVTGRLASASERLDLSASTRKTQFFAKDQAKAARANKFIGRGSAASSTEAYRKATGAAANTGSYTKQDTVFVSAEGARGGSVSPNFTEIGLATKAGATIITDDAANRARAYNQGERVVAAFLHKQGYEESAPGEWRPKANEPTSPKQFTDEEAVGGEDGWEFDEQGTYPGEDDEPVRFSRQRTQGGPALTQQQMDDVKAEVLRMRGPDLKRAWIQSGLFNPDNIEGEYTYNQGARLLRIAIDSLHPMETAYHESMHDFMRLLLRDGKLALRNNLMSVATNPAMKRKLHNLLNGYPEAQKQLSDPEEALAFMFQFWAAGKLAIPTQARTWFQKMAEFIRGLLGIVSTDEQAVQILSALKTGRFADVNMTAAVLDTMRVETLSDLVTRIAGPLKVVSDKLMQSALDRLTTSGRQAFVDIADAFHQSAGREGAPVKDRSGAILDLPFLPRRAKQSGQWNNKLAGIFTGATKAEITEAIIALQSFTTPVSQNAQRIKNDVRRMLDDLYGYMSRAGVADLRQNNAGDWVWTDIAQVQDYFPRMWNADTIRTRRDEFLALMTRYTTPDQAVNIFNALTHGSGQLDNSENEGHMGYSPYHQAVKNRRLTFINRGNAHEFMPFMEKDLVYAMSTYIFQAVHRTEYTRQFGNNGEWIRDKLQQAQEKQDATLVEVGDAAKTVRALEGTLNHKFDPGLRRLFNYAIVYENIALLPFALFASLIDPLGIAVRTGDLKEAWIAFKEGMKGIVDSFTGTEGRDVKTELARLIGVIDDRNMLENVGSLYNGMYMSPFLRKVNDTFFKWNGMDMWNRRMRVAATFAGQRFMLNHRDIQNEQSNRYMKELGLEDMKQYIMRMPNDPSRIALTKEDFLQLGVTFTNAAEAERVVEAMQSAVFKFVDSAILRPNSAHRPVWGSDPAWALVFHLKQFTFSFHNTILKRAGHEMMHGNGTPMLMLASYVPFMIAADFLRGGLTGARQGWDLIDWLANGVDRSGVLGTGTFFSDALQDAGHGTVPGASFLGPTAGHVIDAMQTLAGSPNDTAGRFFFRSMPAGPALRAVIE